MLPLSLAGWLEGRVQEQKDDYGGSAGRNVLPDFISISIMFGRSAFPSFKDAPTWVVIIWKTVASAK